MATRKQRKTAQILLENPGMPISRAMEQAGYKPLTAKTPQNLTESKGFLELFTENITDIELIKTHRAGLEAYSKRARMVGRDDKGNPVYEYVP